MRSVRTWIVRCRGVVACCKSLHLKNTHQSTSTFDSQRSVNSLTLSVREVIEGLCLVFFLILHAALLRVILQSVSPPRAAQAI